MEKKTVFYLLVIVHVLFELIKQKKLKLNLSTETHRKVTKIHLLIVDVYVVVEFVHS